MDTTNVFIVLFIVCIVLVQWWWLAFYNFFCFFFFLSKFLPSPPQTNRFPPNELLLRLISGADLFSRRLIPTRRLPARSELTAKGARRRRRSRCSSSGGGGGSLNNPVQPHSFLPACLRDLDSDSWLIAAAKVWGCVVLQFRMTAVAKPKALRSTSSGQRHSFLFQLHFCKSCSHPLA